jgi:preprotein translocase subunit SecB
MKKSVLQLERYWLRSVSINENGDYKPDPAKQEIALEAKSQRGRSKENPEHWKVDLTVRSKPDKLSQPYEFEIAITGLFKIPEEIGPDTDEKLIIVNGPALLFGAVREVIYSLTGRALFGPLILPAVTFIDEVPEVPKNQS